MNQEWNIRARGEQCGQCGQPFADNETFVSRLVFDPEGYRRDDFCAACWAPRSGEGGLSVWRPVYKKPPPPRAEPLKKETAESLLRQLMESDDPQNRNVIYILAVMLERRRILAERDVQTRADGVKIRVYEHKQSGETFLIPDPELKLRELTAVQAEVLERLGQRSGDAPAAVAAPAPESPGSAE